MKAPLPTHMCDDCLQTALDGLQDGCGFAVIHCGHESTAKTKLLSLPTKLPPLLEGKPAPVMATLLRTEVHAALRELAGG